MDKCALCENEGKWVEIAMCYLCEIHDNELADSFEFVMTMNRENEENYPN